MVQHWRKDRIQISETNPLKCGEQISNKIAMGKGKFLQQMMWEQLDTWMVNENQPYYMQKMWKWIINLNVKL